VHELRIARSKAGMTLMELEAASGVGASTISKIERGVSQPQANTLHKLADALGVEVAELYPKAQARPREPEEYAALLRERGFSNKQIVDYAAQTGPELENMSAKDFLEGLLRTSPYLRRYYREARRDKARTEANRPPRSESA
jgi:transcriptional regulator with XRE-family HTH domain